MTQYTKTVHSFVSFYSHNLNEQLGKNGKHHKTQGSFLSLELIYLSRYLDQETPKWPFWSSSQAATCYYQSHHSKVAAILLSALPKDTASKLAGLSPH